MADGSASGFKIYTKSSLGAIIKIVTVIHLVMVYAVLALGKNLLSLDGPGTTILKNAYQRGWKEGTCKSFSGPGFFETDR